MTRTVLKWNMQVTRYTRRDMTCGIAGRPRKEGPGTAEMEHR